MEHVTPNHGPSSFATRPATRTTALAARIEAAAGLVLDVMAGALVAIETLILLLGVVSRYFFQNPLAWSDELASILLLWTAMVGAVVAYRRVEHMRMGVLADAAGPRMRAFLDALALAAGLAFIGLILHPAIEYARHEEMIVTPALEISNFWRALAMPFGLAAMMLFGVLRIGRSARPVDFMLAFAVLAALAAALFAAQSGLAAIGNYRLIVFFVVLVAALVLLGVPIAFAFGLSTLAYLILCTRTPLSIVVGRMDEGMSHIILLSVPLFVYLGFLLVITGMARTMVNFLVSLIGHVRGGMHFVLVGAMYLVSGISGSKAADMAAVAPVLFPEMEKRGVKQGPLVALLAATGAQTETIPPSIVLITLGSVTGISIASLFKAGLLPSAVLAIVLCVIVWHQHRRDDMAGFRRASVREIGNALLAALPALFLPLVIRGAVVEGAATATEVSTVGITYALLYAAVAATLFRVRIEWKRLWPALVNTAALSGAILFIVGTASAMAWALTQSGFSGDLVAAISRLPGGATAFMAVSILAFVILGSVLEGIPAIVLFGPLLFPIARAVGINDVHYAMVVVTAMGIGLFAPPFGVGYYTACAIGRVNPSDGIRPILPYLAALFVGLVVLAAVPAISTAFL